MALDLPAPKSSTSIWTKPARTMLLHEGVSFTAVIAATGAAGGSKTHPEYAATAMMMAWSLDHSPQA